MQPDEKKEETVAESTDKATEESGTPATKTEISIDEKIEQMMSKFNDKVDEIIKNHTAEVDELKKTINDKDAEISKLKNVNAQILMNTSVAPADKEITDFSTVDFDDVDWDKESSAYMAKIDSKIFS